MATISWRARSLKAALRGALEQTGLSGREIARRLEVSPMRVQRWLDETQPAPTAEDVADFLTAAHEVDDDLRGRILKIAHTDADDVDWLVSGPPGINPQLASVLEWERYAIRIFEFQLVWWPGLLQGSEYARKVISRDTTATQQEIEARVLIRNARRDILTRKTRPVVFDAVITLAAVHGTFTGAEVRAAQLAHVREIAALDNVTVQIARVGDDWTPSAPFIIYEFADMPTTVYLEGYRSSAFIVEPDVVAAYQAAAETLRREAMSPTATAGLIAEAIPTMETTE
jgi:hypothetical protein